MRSLWRPTGRPIRSRAASDVAGEREKEFDVLLVLTDLGRRQHYEKVVDRLQITAAYFAA